MTDQLACEYITLANYPEESGIHIQLHDLALSLYLTKRLTFY